MKQSAFHYLFDADQWKVHLKYKAHSRVAIQSVWRDESAAIPHQKAFWNFGLNSDTPNQHRGETEAWFLFPLKFRGR